MKWLRGKYICGCDSLEIPLTLHNGEWTDEYFQELIKELAEKRDYSWVRPEGIRKELEKMTKDF